MKGDKMANEGIIVVELMVKSIFQAVFYLIV